MKKYINLKMLFGVALSFCVFQALAQDNNGNQETSNSADSVSLSAEVVEQVDLRAIKGRILDVGTKMPILGARVQTQDMQYSAMTKEDGTFTIQVPDYTNRLQISALDYLSLDYPIRNQVELEVALFRSGTEDYTPSLTIDTEIQTKLGGSVRTITHSGTPGIGASMFIRGYNSLNAGAQPLIILDGMIFDNQYDRVSIHDGFVLNPLSNISVDDIESVEVMKDGASIYGTKAGNGVLIIKTKRGKDPVTKITASAMIGYNDKPKTMPVLNASQLRVYMSDMLKSFSSDPSDLSSLPFLNDDPSYYDYKRYHNNNNWKNDVYRTGFTQSYGINVSGGDDVALYNLSMGYADATSTLKANDFSRFNARFNSDVKLTSKLDFSFDISYSQTDRELRDDGFNESRTALVTSPSVLSLIKAPFLIPYEYSNKGNITPDISDADIFKIANPVAILSKGKGESSQTYLSLAVRPTYKITNELSVSGAFNYSFNNMFEKYFRPHAGVPTVVLPEGGNSIRFAKAQNAKQNSISADLHMDWVKKFAVHSVNLQAGTRFMTDSYEGEYGSGHNSATDNDHNLSDGLAYRKTYGYDDSWRSMSWYMKAEYGAYDKYFLSVAASADASSRFGKDADLSLSAAGLNWAMFPEVNAAWYVSSENFMNALPFVSLLKLRAGLGLSGNDNIPEGAAITYFGAIRYIDRYTGLTLLNIGNNKLKMETVTKRSVGADLGLFDNRITLSADFFHNTTNDLLTLNNFGYQIGKEAYWANSGKLENKGFELSVNAKVLAINDFKLEAGANLLHYKNKILSLPDGDYTTPIYGGEVKTSVGNAAGLFYGYKTKGVFSTTKEASEADLKVLDYTGVRYYKFGAGDVWFADLDKSGFIDKDDKTIIGDPNPDFTGAFNLKFTYKKLSLNTMFTYSYGNDIYNYARSQMESGATLNNQSAAMQNRWVNEGQITSIPKLAYGDPLGNSRFSDRWIEDGSYLRLKTLTLAYEVPTNWLFLSGFTVWASANNLWTYTKYLGSDPEFSLNNSVLYQGIDAGLLSQGRSYFVGLKLNL
ncbi:SusC/RagA family TonB-linked outer membrane protein [Dysgonomonas sp. 216]|uniref:SusC/RagA family TonB-linked outer membrane protein n=1 Tax=Dysgonomonas sp. 216 TaxID=2302934 RepID=UPI0013D7E515|nr:SusC/RagA family TonB-linked outer membrane protein [Dysgonomonas sp. 216]NDW17751.1 SusC/RagA family TonB-linked outer membrane protein [Dysgonomonas sp. 216]